MTTAHNFRNKTKNEKTGTHKTHHTMAQEEISSPMTGISENEEDDEDEDGSDLDQDGAYRKNSRHAITGRGVTLGMLLNDRIVESGEGLLSIDYLGRKFSADLQPNGKIWWPEGKMSFNSPSAWAIHCKKMVNPSKKSGCGWASVKYKGRKLDAWKTTWFRRQKPNSFPTPTFNKEESSDVKDEENEENGTGLEDQESKAKTRKTSEVDKTGEAEGRKISVKHSSLGKKRQNNDLNTLVECSTFAAQGRIQPFTISISSNCLLLLDFHSHLTCSEIVGYLGGRWDPVSQHMSVQQAFPCRCRLGDQENASKVENEIRQNMDHRDLMLVGWYHSHTTFQADPSLRDVESQLNYQLQLKGSGNSYQPCLGIIASAYDVHHSRKDTIINAFWVAPPPENKMDDYGMPMSMNYSISQDTYITQDIVNELKMLVDYYQDKPDMINFREFWLHQTTYADKLKLSMARKFPKDQSDGRFLEYIDNLLLR
ncbi:MPN domain-containing protein [Lingula anatina]|uniref:MPN domain-containing protein n=1 Tax=Lingula anatina TaxID=7574 RepID=A0A1S3H8G6_LINAN|nr:MPN domain-containing protein [Lingula anatina]|eukprot:XP_013381776.1 MPN domain-containing protein [Lingula anatina]